MARPREFDEELVIKSALLAFWQNGYEGTSMADLLRVTGLTKSSLYAAYGNKLGIFQKVLEHYHRDHLAFRLLALEQPTPRLIAERVLLGMLNLHINAATPRGCLEVNGALACSDDSEQVRAELSANRTLLRAPLRKRFEQTQGVRGLPEGMTADRAAFYIMTLIYGMAVQARSGASKTDLRQFIETSLLSWPIGNGSPPAKTARAPVMARLA